MKLLAATLTLLALAAPARCSDAARDYPNGWSAADARACLASGGRVTRGMAGPACAMPTADAGKSCTNSEGCESFCLAEGRVCAPETPMFGCFATYENGQTRGLCVD